MKRIYVTIGIDDIFFHPNYENYWYRLVNFLKRRTSLKMTFFTVADYRYIYPSRIRKFLHRYGSFPYPSYTPEAFALSKFPTFLETVTKLQKSGQVEIAGHGWTHCGEGSTGAREFAQLSTENTDIHLKTMSTIFKHCGFPSPIGFSSPGWEYNDILLEMLGKNNFRYIAGSLDTTTPLSPHTFSNQAGIQNVPLTKPKFITRNLINIPRNVSIDTDDSSRALEIAHLQGLVSIHAHLYPIGVTNSMTEHNLSNLDVLLDLLEKKYTVIYQSFSDIALKSA
jgi:hypothetical protein